MIARRRSNMQTIFYALSLLVASCQSMSLTNSIEFSEQHHNHIDDGFNAEDVFARGQRKDQSQSGVKPYVLFVTKPPAELTVNEGEGHTLECEAFGNPRPIIYWTINNRLITQGRVETEESVEKTSEGKVLGLASLKSRLFLDCITRAEHQASYGCVAVTSEDRKALHTKLIVRPARNAADTERTYAHQLLDAQPSTDANGRHNKARTCAARQQSSGSAPRIFLVTGTSMEYLGQRTTLHCRADGFPRPEIKWYHYKNETATAEIHSEGRFQVLPNGDLQIRDLEFAEVGQYKCVAKNVHGQDSVEKVFLYPTSPDDKE